MRKPKFLQIFYQETDNTLLNCCWIRFKQLEERYIRPLLLKVNTGHEPKILKTYSELTMRDAVNFASSNPMTWPNGKSPGSFVGLLTNVPSEGSMSRYLIDLVCAILRNLLRLMVMIIRCQLVSESVLTSTMVLNSVRRAVLQHLRKFIFLWSGELRRCWHDFLSSFQNRQIWVLNRPHGEGTRYLPSTGNWFVPIIVMFQHIFENDPIRNQSFCSWS